MFDSDWLVDPYAQLRFLLPKLAQPSWVRLIGEQIEIRKRAGKPSKPAEKAIRRNERRILRALNGEYTRVRTAA